LIVVGATAFVVSPSSVKTVVNERFDPSTSEDVRSYISGRAELWKNGWKHIVDMILSQLRGYRYYGSPHNEYLRALAEHGLIGLIVFLLIFFKIYGNHWKQLRTLGENSCI